ncbi:MAG: imidazolonepropionase [Thermoplasmatota archaeon]
MEDEKDTLLIHNIGRIVTFPGTGPVSGSGMDEPDIIESCALSVRNGRIGRIDTEEGIWSSVDLAPDARCVDAGGRCVVAGFIDPHTHAVFAGSREFELSMKLKGSTYLEILKAGGGILRTMRDTRSASAGDLIYQMNERLDKMMIYGTTTAEVKSGYGLDPESELKLLRAVKESDHPMDLIPTFLGPHAVPPEYSDDPDGFIDIMIDLLPQVVDEDLAVFADIFCEKGVFNADQSKRFLSAARDAGLKIKIHSDEIENLGGTIVGAELGAVSAEHLLVSTDEDLKAMKSSGTIPVLLPGTLMTIFEDRVPRARDMIDMGLSVALATDINPNCWVESMQFIQALGSYRLRMTPNETLAATTVNAAHAVGLGDRKGRIREGYDADILILKDPSFDHVVYNFGVNHVHTVVKGGEVVHEDIGW